MANSIQESSQVFVESSPLAPGLSSARGRVLVVEDHSSLNFLLSIRLRRSGFLPLSAFDGMSAIERAERERPDAIILDLGLPRLGGLDLLRSLRSNALTFDIPLVLLTGQALESDVVEYLFNQPAVRGVFFKPTPAVKVVRAVEGIIDGTV